MSEPAILDGSDWWYVVNKKTEEIWAVFRLKSWAYSWMNSLLNKDHCEVKQLLNPQTK